MIIKRPFPLAAGARTGVSRHALRRASVPEGRRPARRSRGVCFREQIADRMRVVRRPGRQCPVQAR